MSAPNKPHPITALPFVFDHAPKSRIDPRRSFWHVEPLGDYKEDCRTGSRYAIEYLRLVADDDRFDGGGYLAMIVDHMRAALAEKERSGIEVGFLQTIGFAARFGWRQAEQHHLDVEYHWQTEGTGALVNQRPDGSVVIEQPDGTRAVYRKVGCRMSADIVRLFPVTEPTRTIGELVTRPMTFLPGNCGNACWRRLRRRANSRRSKPNRARPSIRPSFANWVTLGALVTRYLFKTQGVSGQRSTRI